MSSLGECPTLARAKTRTCVSIVASFVHKVDARRGHAKMSPRRGAAQDVCDEVAVQDKRSGDVCRSGTASKTQDGARETTSSLICPELPCTRRFSVSWATLR